MRSSISHYLKGYLSLIVNKLLIVQMFHLQIFIRKISAFSMQVNNQTNFSTEINK